MKVTPRLIFTTVLVVLLVAFNLLALNLNYQARMFPLIIGVPVMLLAIVQWVLELRQARGKKAKAAVEPKKEHAEADEGLPRTPRRVLTSSAWVVGLLGSIYVLGFIVTIFMYPLLYMKFVGRRSWKLSLVISLGAIAFVYLAMIQGLNVDLYDGLVPGALRKSIYGY